MVGLASSLLSQIVSFFLKASASLLCFTLLFKVGVCLGATMKLDEVSLWALQSATACWIGKPSASIPAKKDAQFWHLKWAQFTASVLFVSI